MGFEVFDLLFEESPVGCGFGLQLGGLAVVLLPGGLRLAPPLHIVDGAPVKAAPLFGFEFIQFLLLDGELRAKKVELLEEGGGLMAERAGREAGPEYWEVVEGIERGTQREKEKEED